MGGIIYLDLSPTIVGPDISTDGDLAERRCVRVKDDQSQRSKCPGGGIDIMASILNTLRFEVPTSAYDPTYRTIVRTQDDGQGYSISISNGSLTTERLTEEFTERVEISPDDATASTDSGYPWQIDLSQKTEYVPDTVILASISGSCLDEQGDSTSTPATKKSGVILYLQKKVYADVSVKYLATTDASLVEIEPGDDQENNYQSQLLVSSECGGLARFNIDVPACFQSAWDSFRLAGGDGGDDGGDGDTAAEEEIGGADLLVDKNVCTGEVEERIQPK